MIRVFILLLTTLASSFAFAQAPVCVPTFDGSTDLQLVNTVKTKLKNPVNVQWNLDEKHLIVNFDVDSSVLNEKKVFGANDYPFKYDVVEIFLAVNDPADKEFAYYEFELTPNKQTFDVKINVASDGKKKFEEGINVGVEVATNVTKKNWSGSFSIPLENLGWKGDVKFLRGNFFTILDKKPNRQFWSSFLPKQVKVDFHKPEHFKSLFECK